MKSNAQRPAGKNHPNYREDCGLTSSSFNSPNGAHTKALRSGRLRHRGVVLVWVAILLLEMISHSRPIVRYG